MDRVRIQLVLIIGFVIINYSVAALPVNKEKESQVVWEDPQEVEERRKLLGQMEMRSMEKSLQSLQENDQNTTEVEMETMGSIDVDNLTANMLEAEKENHG